MQRCPSLSLVHRAFLALATLGLLSLLVACGGDDEPEAGSDAPSDASAGGPADGAAAASAAGVPPSGHAGSGRGEASLLVGEGRWTTSVATASRRDDGRLRISAGGARADGDAYSGTQLNLVIGNYRGPGNYHAQVGSMWLRLGDDAVKAAAVADGSPDPIHEALSGATTVHLSRATINIGSEAGGFITGSYHMAAGAVRGMPEVQGSFRARILD